MSTVYRRIYRREATTAQIDSSKHARQLFFNTSLDQLGYYKNNGTTIRLFPTMDSSNNMLHDINMDGNNLYFDDDGDSYIYSPSDDRIDIWIGGSGRYVFENAAMTVLHTGGIIYGGGVDINMDLITVDRASTDAKLQWDDDNDWFHFSENVQIDSVLRFRYSGGNESDAIYFNKSDQSVGHTIQCSQGGQLIFTGSIDVEGLLQADAGALITGAGTTVTDLTCDSIDCSGSIEAGILGFGAMTNATIASDSVTPTSSYVNVTPQDGVADDLSEIVATNFSDGDIIILRNSIDGGSAITVKNGVTNIVCGADRVLDKRADRIILQYDATESEWWMLSYADNA